MQMMQMEAQKNNVKIMGILTPKCKQLYFCDGYTPPLNRELALQCWLESKIGPDNF